VTAVRRGGEIPLYHFSHRLRDIFNRAGIFSEKTISSLFLVIRFQFEYSN